MYGGWRGLTKCNMYQIREQSEVAWCVSYMSARNTYLKVRTRRSLGPRVRIVIGDLGAEQQGIEGGGA